MNLRVVKETPPPEDWSAIMPCPFCSSEARLLTSARFYEKHLGESSCVICINPKCGAAGPMIEAGDEALEKEVLEKRAIKRWNKRGNLSGAEAKLKRIASILNSNR